ncbi:hypothetical protein MRX96_040772 [Rhipicephalus microplus]
MDAYGDRRQGKSQTYECNATWYTYLPFRPVNDVTVPPGRVTTSVADFESKLHRFTHNTTSNRTSKKLPAGKHMESQIRKRQFSICSTRLSPATTKRTEKFLRFVGTITTRSSSANKIIPLHFEN